MRGRRIGLGRGMGRRGFGRRKRLIRWPFFRRKRLIRWPFFRRRRFRLFWWRYMIGGFMVLARIDSRRYVKLQKEDVKRIEKSSGKAADQMTEQELDTTIRQLDITAIELTPEDRVYIDARPKVECPACGAPIQGTANFCVNCGIQIPR